MKRPIILTFSLNKPTDRPVLPKKEIIHYKMDLGSDKDVEIYKRQMRGGRTK